MQPSTLPVALAPSPSRPFPHTVPGRIAAALAATAFVALCAHISIPLPFTPVPLTLQPFAVLLVGMLLGPATGFAAMALYLAEGASGLPVFTPQGPLGLARLLGPTAGYLFAYPLAAAIAGAIARRTASPSRRFLSAIAAGLTAIALIYLSGAAWLAHLLHLSPLAAMHFAVTPFIPGEVIKIAAAATLFTALRSTRTTPS